ncbi:hypothetical protein AMJ39_06785 [candidate division TA06 bacterium DG_24]|uniref:Cohesin domain-containing protein n=2 Tax=Bacteria division TA06 TaxID=1156500 RepID=A0A0S8GAW9_UNCT6|nr:MAG: hypothetical protein AMJ39_06785 [candidate division TA06 bacterium DG_24]KPK68988.1 MAG: hypothetical protein AMJ82_06790 [candidate division TA06 bacterium SM23_40]
MGTRRSTIILVVLLIAGLVAYAAERRVLASRQRTLDQLRSISVASLEEEARLPAGSGPGAEASADDAASAVGPGRPGATPTDEDSSGQGESPALEGRSTVAEDAGSRGEEGASVYIGWSSESDSETTAREQGAEPSRISPPEEVTELVQEATGPFGAVLDASAEPEDPWGNWLAPPDTQSGWFFGAAESVQAGPIWDETGEEPGVGGTSRTSISFTPQSQSPRLGQIVTVQVNVQNVSDFFRASFDVEFDPGILEAVNVKEGNFASKDWRPATFESQIDNAAGRIFVTVARENPGDGGVAGSGSLARIKFRALSAGVSTLGFVSGVVMDSKSMFVPVQLGSGTVKVRSSR